MQLWRGAAFGIFLIIKMFPIINLGNYKFTKMDPLCFKDNRKKLCFFIYYSTTDNKPAAGWFTAAKYPNVTSTTQNHHCCYAIMFKIWGFWQIFKYLCFLVFLMTFVTFIMHGTLCWNMLRKEFLGNFSMNLWLCCLSTSDGGYSQHLHLCRMSWHFREEQFRLQHRLCCKVCGYSASIDLMQNYKLYCYNIVTENFFCMKYNGVINEVILVTETVWLLEGFLWLL